MTNGKHPHESKKATEKKKAEKPKRPGPKQSQAARILTKKVK